jgi:hypothetical protein
MEFNNLRISKVLRILKKWGYDEPRIHLHLMTLRLRERLFVKSYADFDFHQIPIIINNYNRLEYPLMLIQALERMGYSNIYIIDNKSSYPPLLEYYNHCPYKVFRLDKNVGHLALWETGINKMFRNQWFIYTDADILPGRDCPADFVEKMYHIAQKYNALKVGFALRIDDLPDCYEHKLKVQRWERHFWERPLEPDVYDAEIDTTFALYRPNVQRRWIDRGLNVRMGGDMTAYHMPWYLDSANLSEEERYYISTCNPGASWVFATTPNYNSANESHQETEI